jgi:hypothetical protein
MDLIRQVISDFKPDLIVGSALIILGLIIPVFRLYWLIAGVNTAPKEELRKIDLKYVGKYFGIFIGGLGLLQILNPFILSYFGLKSYVRFAQPITVISVIIFMYIFGAIKKNRIYKPGIDKEKK